jgi:hypothetical protein
VPAAESHVRSRKDSSRTARGVRPFERPTAHAVSASERTRRARPRAPARPRTPMRWATDGDGRAAVVRAHGETLIFLLPYFTPA